ncbi:MAG: MFS transporter [Parvibaculaceae bacterium]
MPRGLHSVWPLLFGIGLLALGNGLQGSLVGIRATAEHFSATATGIMMSGFSAGLLVSSLLTPLVVGRVGHVRVFVAFASIVSTAILMIPLWVNGMWWFAMRFIAGVCVAGLYIVCESWLNSASTNETRGKILSIYMIVIYGAMGLGQLLLNIQDTSGFARFILVSALMSLALVPISLANTEAPSIERPRTVSFAALYRGSPLAAVASFVNGLGQSAFFSMGAVYGVMQGLPLAYLSLMMALPPLGVIVSQYPIGFLSDRYDRRALMIALAFASAAVAALTIPVAEFSVLPLIGLFAIFGAISMPLYSLAIAHANDHLDKDQMLGASSKLVFLYGAGSTAGPLLAGLAMQQIGKSGFMTYMILVYGALGLFALYRISRRAAPRRSEAELPQVSPATTPVAATALAETLNEPSR